MKIEIAVSLDRSYLQHLYVLLQSITLCKSSEDIYNIHVLHANLQKSDQCELENFYEGTFKFYFYEVHKIENLYTNAHISIETYYRVLLPNILNENIRKILYLDCDMLVKQNLSELWEKEIDGYAIAAVFDHKAQFRKEELNIPSQYNYFNAGVLIMNLKYWREKHLTPEILDYIRTQNNQLMYWDQDALNKFLYNKVLWLEEKWNIQTATFSFDNISSKVLENPAIVHFTGASKPWHISSVNIYKKDYFNCLKMTPFKKFTIVSKDVELLINSKKSLYLWGAGETGKVVYNYLNIEIEGFIDSNTELIGRNFLNKPIFSIEQIEMSNEIGIIICSGHFKDISSVLESKGFCENIDYVHQM